MPVREDDATGRWTMDDGRYNPSSIVHRPSSIVYALWSRASHRPGAGDQRDRAVGGDRQAGADGVAQGGPALLGQRQDVGRRGALPAQERAPVIVKITEGGWHVDGADGDRLQARRGEQVGQWTRL